MLQTRLINSHFISVGGGERTRLKWVEATAYRAENVWGPVRALMSTHCGHTRCLGVHLIWKR
jgi:hypothetical protein